MVCRWVRKRDKNGAYNPCFKQKFQTMARIISENVLPGTTIITEQWRAYSAALRDYTTIEHRQISQSLNFLDPEDPSVHTQTIEGLWSLMKRFLRGRNGIYKRQQS
ncbi:hypothetical protein DMUE_3547 [Dictyocoela muelleri]|nr:hypothetical protein DMUE_3547 [Dictyocoela muelleri]